MDLQGALRARLLAAAPVTALVGQRIYWVVRPQATELPAITLETVTGDRPRTYGGLQATRAPRVQMNVWAPDYSLAQQVIAAAVAALAPTQVTSNGIYFDQIDFESEGDSLERLGTTDIIHKRIDLIVWHSPA